MRCNKAIFLTGLFLSAARLLFGVEGASDGETKIGEWNSNISQTIAKGEADNIPIVMIGTAFGCTICANFKAQILPNAKFKQ